MDTADVTSDLHVLRQNGLFPVVILLDCSAAVDGLIGLYI